MKKSTVYNVVVSDRAEQDYDEFIGWLVLDQHSISLAIKWFNGLKRAFEKLERFPLAYPRIPESDLLNREVRGVCYKSHRVIYHVGEPSKTVTILRIYHSSRQPLDSDDI